MIDFLSDDFANILPKMIGDRLRNERKERQITQEQLSNAIYTDRQTIMKWESKKDDKNDIPKSLPSLNQLILLANYYKVSPSYLLCEYDEKTEPLAACKDYLGLQSESIEILHSLLSAKGNSYDLLQNFINHFLKQSYDLILLLNEYSRLNTLSKEFETDDKEKIKNVYNKIISQLEIQPLVEEPIYHIIGLLKNTAHNYYGDRWDKQKELLIDKVIYYWDVLNPSKRSLLTYRLSVFFTDLVKNFFDVSNSSYSSENINQTVIIKD